MFDQSYLFQIPLFTRRSELGQTRVLFGITRSMSPGISIERLRFEPDTRETAPDTTCCALCQQPLGPEGGILSERGSICLGCEGDLPAPHFLDRNWVGVSLAGWTISAICGVLHSILGTLAILAGLLGLGVAVIAAMLVAAGAIREPRLGRALLRLVVGLCLAGPLGFGLLGFGASMW